MRVFDADRQEWVGPEQERRVAELHRRDAARQRHALRGAVTVLAVCGLAFGTWALGWKDEPGTRGWFVVLENTATDAPGPDEPDPGGTTEGPSPSSPAAPPAGYEAVQDPEGFRVAVPEGWDRGTTDAVFGFDVVHYRSPDGTRRLQVYQVEEATPDESVELYLSDAVPKPRGFEELAREDAGRDGLAAVRFEYLADSLKGEPDVGPWHVVDHRFESVDHRVYAIAGYGPDAAGREDERRLVDTALDWFCPPDTQCPAPGGG
ncbi:hypothetical protein [Streptomyces minutiscleroticus]|uniref:hypothetical protein n=1 Tax=Streptomyces minutiscleroticus TaxID=68238 RepID=UPI00331CC620